VSPKGLLLAAKQKLLPRLQHVQPQPGGGLELALFRLSQFSGAEVDDDYAVLTHHGEAFAADNDGRGITDAHAEEGMGEGILNVGLFQVLLGK